MDASRASHVRSDARGERSISAFDDSVTLGRAETWAIEQVRRHGLKPFVVRTSLIAVVASGLLTALGLVPMGAYGSLRDWMPALVMGLVIPALVAPPMLWFSLRLVVRLDVASSLLRRAAVTDPLTGVLNRRGFFDALAAADVRDGRWRVAMIDVDDFKSLNDHHGHATGDAALRDVAAWLTAQVGGGGCVGRLGGDEFALAVPATADRLPERAHFDLNGLEFTASIGQTTGLPGVDIAASLASADAELYDVKAERDRPSSCPDGALASIARRLV